MSHDEGLVARVRDLLGSRTDIEEKRMFGGLTFMVGGHMCCGVAGDELVVRVGIAGAREAIKRPHARYCDFTGRPMKTMVSITPEGFESDEALKSWVRQAVEFAGSQPPKN